MRRGSANGKFCSILQVAVADITNVLNSSLIEDYSDETHVVFKCRSYYKKLPLHNGGRFSHAMDMKLLGFRVDTSMPYINSAIYAEDTRNLTGDGTFSPTQGRSQHPIYTGAYAPQTLIHYVHDDRSGGDREIYLFMSRQLFADKLNVGFTKVRDKAKNPNQSLFLHLQVDFMDGSSVPVVAQCRRMPIISLNEGNDISRLQVGPLPEGQDNWMTFTPNIRGASGFSGQQSVTLYSFTRLGTANGLLQNTDLSAFGNSSVRTNPYALPIFRVEENDGTDAGANIGPFRVNQGSKGVLALSWVEGVNRYINGSNTGDVSLNEDPVLNEINLGQFFEMDRMDSSSGDSPGTASYGGIANASWGRKYGVVNFFSVNHANVLAYPYNGWGNNGIGQTVTNKRINHGIGPNLGYCSPNRPNIPEPAQTRSAGTTYDQLYHIQSGFVTGGTGIKGSTMHAPKFVGHLFATAQRYGNPDDMFVATNSVDAPNSHADRMFSSIYDRDLEDGSDCFKFLTPPTDSKCSYFNQGMSIAGGYATVTAARVMLTNKVGLTRAASDFNAYSFLCFLHGLYNSADQTVNSPGGAFDGFVAGHKLMKPTNYSIDLHYTYTPGLWGEPSLQDAGYDNDGAGLQSKMFSLDGELRTFWDIVKNFPSQLSTNGGAAFANTPVTGYELFAHRFFNFSAASMALDTYTYGYETYDTSLNATGGFGRGVLQGSLGMDSPETSSGGASGDRMYWKDDAGVAGSTEAKIPWISNGGTGDNVPFYMGVHEDFDGTTTTIGTGGDSTALTDGVSIDWASFCKKTVISAYQDVYFICAMAATSSKDLTAELNITTSTECSRQRPWHPIDTYKAYHPEDTNPYNNGPTLDGPADGTYYQPPAEEITNLFSGGKAVVNYWFAKGEASKWPVNSVPSAYSTSQAFASGACTKCTDLTTEQGRNNLDGTIVSTGYNVTGTPLGYVNGATVEDFSEGTNNTVYYTGTTGPNTQAVGGAESCVYATGLGGCLEFLSANVEISDTVNGFATDAGFDGLTVRATIRYRNTCSGSGSTAFKSGNTPDPDTISGVLDIWNIKYVPGNAGSDLNTDSQSYYTFAIPVTVEDADDITELSIESLGSSEYELKIVFSNSSDFIVASNSEEPIQVFPDLPLIREMNTFSTLDPGTNSTDTVGPFTPENISTDAFRSEFFNQRVGTSNGSSYIPGGPLMSKFITSAHTALDGMEESGNSVVPYRASKLVIEPVSSTYKDEGRRIFDFVTYGEYRKLTGCTDPDDINFDPEALEHDEDACGGPQVLGCTDANAQNFNPNATTDDGSCDYCSQNLGILSGTAAGEFPNADNLSTFVNSTSGTTGFRLRASNNSQVGGTWDTVADGTAFTVASGQYQGTIGYPALGYSPFISDLGNNNTLNQTNYPWYNALSRTGCVVARTTTSETSNQLTGYGSSPDDPQTDTMDLTIVVTMPMTGILEEGDDPANNSFEDQFNIPSNHGLRVYEATDALIDFIEDNNSNTGSGAQSIFNYGGYATTGNSSTENKFITQDLSDHPGYNKSTNTSSLQNAGFNPAAVITAASSGWDISGLAGTKAVKFVVQGNSSNYYSTPLTNTQLKTDVLYVLEYILVDKNCGTSVNYPAFFSYTMIGRCGCVNNANINFPAVHPWQQDGSNSFPVVHDNTDCAEIYVQGPGDSGQLCFTPDDELSSCDSLYEYCFISEETRCLYEEVDTIAEALFDNVNYYAPHQTTVIVQIEGIYNPATNQYVYQDANGNLDPDLQYIITPIVTTTEGEVEVLGDLAVGPNDPGANITDGGIQHTFTFINVQQYTFEISFTNPDPTGIYSGLDVGGQCTFTLVGTPVTPPNDCIIIVGCTDEDAINHDPNATLDDGSCEYTDCEQIYNELAGGFSAINTSVTNATSECATETVTVFGEETTNDYVQFNTDGTITVQVVVNTVDFPEFVGGSIECNIALAPANIVGMPDIPSQTELVYYILNNAIALETDGGTLDIAGSATGITISPKQVIDVPLTSTTDITTDFVNRDYTETTADAGEDGHVFSNLASGEYFVFVYPVQSSFINNEDFNLLECVSEAFINLDQVTRVVVNANQPDVPCEEDCGNPAGCDNEVYGCTDPDNTAYDENATVDDGTCVPSTECDENSTDPNCFDCGTEFATRLVGGRILKKNDGEVDPCDPVTDSEGCTDPNACNYDPLIDSSDSNNQLCDYCSCNEFSEDCCEGDDCGCDPQVDEDCPDITVDPECPDPTNPDCGPGGPDPCYDPADCPPPVDPCVIFGDCEPPPPPPPPPPKDPVIEIVTPISYPCDPELISGDMTFSDIQEQVMTCHANHGTKVLSKMKSGIKWSEEDFLALDLIVYLFLGGADSTALPCLFNCNYESKSVRETATSLEQWAKGGRKKWASTSTYKRGEVVVYYYNTYGKTKKSFFRATRDIFAGEIHPRYRDSGWSIIVERKPKRVDPLGISDGTETYLQDFFEYYTRFCSNCTVGTLGDVPSGNFARYGNGPNKQDNVTPKTNPTGINRNSASGSNYGFLGPDGEEIIF